MPSHQERVRRNYDPQDVVKSLPIGTQTSDADGAHSGPASPLTAQTEQSQKRHPESRQSDGPSL
jgi:hypothetical protein